MNSEQKPTSRESVDEHAVESILFQNHRNRTSLVYAANPDAGVTVTGGHNDQ